MQALERLKPASSRRTRLLLAALLWTATGSALLAVGGRWLLGTAGAWGWPALAASVGLGWAKGRWILAPRAGSNAVRILRSDDERCVGGVFTWPVWGLVAAMAAAGYALRHSSAPRAALGVVYSAIGSALILGSLASWRGWRRAKVDDEGR